MGTKAQGDNIQVRQKPRGAKAQGDKTPQGQNPMEDNIQADNIPGGQNPKICVFVLGACVYCIGSSSARDFVRLDIVLWVFVQWDFVLEPIKPPVTHHSLY